MNLILLLDFACLLSASVWTADWVWVVPADGSTDQALILEATRIANEEYERIRDFLGVTDVPYKRFEVRFKPEIWLRDQGPAAGFTRGSVIELSLDRLRKKEDVGPILVHEMVHLYQTYRRGGRDYWREGIADFVSAELGYERERLVCDFQYPHFSAGYSSAAAFLRTLERQHPGAVKKLHAAHLRGTYSREHFEKDIGIRLEEEWALFKNTPGYVESADRMFSLQREIEKESGRTLLNLKRFIRTLEGGTLTVDAMDFVEARAHSAELPGYASAEKVKAFVFEGGDLRQQDRYPSTRFIRFLSGKNRFSYELHRQTEHENWQIRRMWKRRDSDGKVLKSATF